MESRVGMVVRACYVANKSVVYSVMCRPSMENRVGMGREKQTRRQKEGGYARNERILGRVKNREKGTKKGKENTQKKGK